MPLTVHFFLLVSSVVLLLCSSTSCLANQYQKCLVDTITCEDIEFSYPFGKNGSGCGDPEFQLHSCDYESHPLINIGGNDYHILESSLLANSSTLRILNDNLWGEKCNFSGNYSQFWWPASPFQTLDTYTNITLWKYCNDQIPEILLSGPVYPLSLCGEDWFYSLNPLLDLEQTPFCDAFQLPINKASSPFFINNQTLLREGFEVTWQVESNRYQRCEDCLNSNGRCGYNISKPTTFLCYCSDGSTHPDECPDTDAEDTRDQNISAIAIGCFIVGAAVITIALALVLFSTYDACKRRNPPQILQGNENSVANPSSFFNSSSAPEPERSSSVETKV
eukprot:PITA_07386